MFARRQLLVALLPRWKPLRVSSLFCGDRMCPGITEAKPHSSFFGGDFRRGFDYGAQWITNLTGVFAVGVIDASELVALAWSHGRAHGHS